jgi:hypothetical protein
MVYNEQQLEIIQMSNKKKMIKQIVVQKYDWILYCHVIKNIVK